MNQSKIIKIVTNVKKPTDCKIKIEDEEIFYKITVNEQDFNLLNENSKKNVYEYLNDLENILKKLNKMTLIVKEKF